MRLTVRVNIDPKTMITSKTSLKFYRITETRRKQSWLGRKLDLNVERHASARTHTHKLTEGRSY